MEDSAVAEVEGVTIQEVSAVVQVVVEYSAAVEVVAEDLDQVGDLVVRLDLVVHQSKNFEFLPAGFHFLQHMVKYSSSHNQEKAHS